MKSNFLKFNEAKTEFMVVGSKQHRSIITDPTLRIGEAIISPSGKVKNLGVIMDSELKMNNHISAVSQAVCLSLRSIGLIRKYINTQTVELLIHSLVMSKLDMCNSLMYGVNKTQLFRMQRLQNMAARLVTWSPKSSHITPIIKPLVTS